MLRESFYGRENKALTDQLCEELTGILTGRLTAYSGSTSAVGSNSRSQAPTQSS